MKAKNINPSCDFLKIILGVLLFISIVFCLAYWSRGEREVDKRQLNKMRSFHSDKGLVVIEDGLVIIKK